MSVIIIYNIYNYIIWDPHAQTIWDLKACMVCEILPPYVKEVLTNIMSLKCVKLYIASNDHLLFIAFFLSTIKIK